MSVIYVFMKQIFRAAEKAPPSPPPPQCCAGVGWLWLFSARSSEFGYGFEAVRIRVNSCFYFFDNSFYSFMRQYTA
jgi:hypothetical protein